MFLLVLLSYVLSQGSVSTSTPLVVGRYSSMDDCKSAASHVTWINSHGADASKFGFLCINASTTMGTPQMMKAPGR
jgi:hypothetical protein